MKNSIKTGIISATFATIPLNVNANHSDVGCWQKNTNTELFTNLEKNISQDIGSTENTEYLDVIGVEPKIVIEAVLNYFDEDVKMFTLSQEAKNKLTLMLNPYLSAHPIFKVGRNGNLIFEIDDKKAFTLMVKDFVNIVLDDMPFLVRKIIIPLFLGGYNTIQQKLDNLESTAMNLKEKQYKDVVFDNVAGFTKRVAKSVKGNMTIGDYYNIVDGYYPNKNAENIRAELDRLGLTNQDIKTLKYPFKK